MSHVQLIHDVIPILYPEWTPWFGPSFRRWVKDVAGVSDLLLTISQNSRKDLESFAASEGFPLPPVRTVRFGTGFPAGFSAVKPASAEAAKPAPVLPERFVLCVSTLENRKNHDLLLTAWRNLVETHGAEKIPRLILVGRVSYFVVDTWRLRAKLLDPRFNQRVVAVGDLSDAGLAEAYRRCLFTVFPSLYEGWGLPVEESLLHGKFCVASNSSSMPEVGEDWIDYFDPKDASDAQRALERVLFEPGYLEARERRIRADYRPFSWRDCALEFIQHAERLAAAAIPGESWAGESTTIESTSS